MSFIKCHILREQVPQFSDYPTISNNFSFFLTIPHKTVFIMFLHVQLPPYQFFQSCDRLMHPLHATDQIKSAHIQTAKHRPSIKIAQTRPAGKLHERWVLR